MKNSSILIIAGLALIAFLVFSQVKKAKDDLQDFAADTFVGEIIGLNTVEGSEAKNFFKRALWLNHSYYNWLTGKFKVTDYDFNLLDLNVVNDIVNDIVDSNYVIFDRSTLDRILTFGLQFSPIALPPDKPDQLVGALSRIHNQIQALQVVDRYYTITQKNLGSAIAHWLPDPYLIQAYNLLKNLPTGVKRKGAAGELTRLPSP